MKWENVTVGQTLGSKFKIIGHSLHGNGNRLENDSWTNGRTERLTPAWTSVWDKWTDGDRHMQVR